MILVAPVQLGIFCVPVIISSLPHPLGTVTSSFQRAVALEKSGIIPEKQCLGFFPFYLFPNLIFFPLCLLLKALLALPSPRFPPSLALLRACDRRTEGLCRPLSTAKLHFNPILMP